MSVVWEGPMRDAEGAPHHFDRLRIVVIEQAPVGQLVVEIAFLQDANAQYVWLPIIRNKQMARFEDTSGLFSKRTLYEVIQTLAHLQTEAGKEARDV